MFTNTDTHPAVPRYLAQVQYYLSTDAAASTVHSFIPPTVPTVLIDVHHPPQPTPD